MRRSIFSLARCIGIPPLIISAQLTFADVSALGRIEPYNGVVNITAPVVLEAGNGILLSELHTKTGDLVEKGALLAVTEGQKMLAALRAEAQASHQLSKHNVLAAQALAGADCVKADVSRREADRRLSLLNQNLSSIEESERASASAKFEEASCRASQIVATASQAKVDVAKSHLELRETALNRTNVYAPFTGRVLNIVAWPGEAIGPRGILEFGQTDRMYAIAEIYETDIGQVKVDQIATISSKALSAPLRGTVETIRPMVRKQDVMGTDPSARKDARIIEVEIRIENSQAVESLTNLQVEILIES